MIRLLAGRYQLISQLDRGGMGSVWVALDTRLDAQVAVKLLESSLAGDEKSRERFLLEAKTAAALRTPHVVQVMDCGVQGNTPYIVMELLQGQSLRERLREAVQLSPTETARVLGDVADAMHHAHELRIVHRDLKPENVYLARLGSTTVVKVLDFGIAKRLTTSLGQRGGALTAPGTVFGTPDYMSPEQIDGRGQVDHRADLWALAVMAFECLTGQLPFDGETVSEQFAAICAGPIPVPSAVATVPQGFDEWFARGVQRERSERFATAAEARRELDEVCGVAPAHRPSTTDAPQREIAVRALFANATEPHPRALASGKQPLYPVREVTAAAQPATANASTHPPLASTIATRLTRRGPGSLVAAGAAATIAIVGLGIYFLLSGGAGSPGGSASQPSGAAVSQSGVVGLANTLPSVSAESVGGHRAQAAPPPRDAAVVVDADSPRAPGGAASAAIPRREADASVPRVAEAPPTALASSPATRASATGSTGTQSTSETAPGRSSSGVRVGRNPNPRRSVAKVRQPQTDLGLQ